MCRTSLITKKEEEKEEMKQKQYMYVSLGGILTEVLSKSARYNRSTLTWESCMNENLGMRRQCTLISTVI